METLPYPFLNTPPKTPHTAVKNENDRLKGLAGRGANPGGKTGLSGLDGRDGHFRVRQAGLVGLGSHRNCHIGNCGCDSVHGKWEAGCGCLCHVSTMDELHGKDHWTWEQFEAQVMLGAGVKRTEPDEHGQVPFSALEIGDEFELTWNGKAMGRSYVKTGRASYGTRTGEPLWDWYRAEDLVRLKAE